MPARVAASALPRPTRRFVDFVQGICFLGSMATMRYIVSDIPRAVAFYSRKLVFKVEKQVGRAIANVVHGDLSLWLSGPESSAGRPQADGRRAVPGGWNRIVLKVEKLDEVVAALAKAEVPFRGEMMAGPGGRKIIVEDPDGNPIELFEASA